MRASLSVGGWLKRADWGRGGVFLLLALLLGGCANVGYLPSEGQGILLPAKPGTKQVVDGMDVWIRGGPGRPAWVLGTVVETRGKGPIGGGGTLRGLVKQAKKRKADAVVLLQKQSQWVGDALEEVVLPDWEVNREALLIRYREPKSARGSHGQKRARLGAGAGATPSPGLDLRIEAGLGDELPAHLFVTPLPRTLTRNPRKPILSNASIAKCAEWPSATRSRISSGKKIGVISSADTSPSAASFLPAAGESL
ncbi:MAG: hypothetical protein AB7T14_02695 [Candidatus Methylacidiphilaceae bacterium]